MTAVPRILLLEDDRLVTSFVDMALEGQGIELRAVTSVAAAAAELARGPCALVITDLMLPGESGLDLVRQMKARGHAARVAVFSAGVTAQVREELEALAVWRVLPKPASVAQLRQCVADALAEGPAHAVVPAIVDEYFGGNVAIYTAYRSGCAGRMPEDIAAGDAALSAGDQVALRRIGHNFKTVLRTLGMEEGACRARVLEQVSADGGDSASAWQALRPHLEALAAEILP